MKRHQLLYILLLFLLVGVVACNSKKGCTDVNAINFNKKAKVDDGSCNYSNFNLTPKFIVSLKSIFNENSGLAIVQGNVWSFTDSGGDPVIYVMDVVKGDDNENITISGALNVDWEDISTDNNNFYIGDVGNNNGNRSDLGIYIAPKIDTSNLKSSNKSSGEFIKFSYPDQTDFRSNANNNYDAEAIIYLDSYIYIFTKRHSDLQTSVYQVPAQVGTWKAVKVGTFDSKGLITGADVSPDKKAIVLTGYNPISDKAFLWVLRNVQAPTLFDCNKYMVEIGSRTSIGQVEGVAFVNNDSILLSNEQYKTIPPSLYGLNISQVK